jgi:hypothetical protein
VRNQLLTIALALAPALLPASVIGPDTFGYTARSNSDPGGIAFNWTDISGTGARLGQSDDAVFATALGSGFSFYGNTYTSANVSSNGNIQFDSSNITWRDTVPANGFGATIFAFSDDLYFNAAPQGVYYQYFAAGVHPGLSGPTSIMQWTGVYCCSSSSIILVQVQALLEHSAGRILLQYDNADAYARNRALIGIPSAGAPGSASIQWLARGVGQPMLPQSTVPFSSVPEPSTYVLMGASLVGLSMLRRAKGREV